MQNRLKCNYSAVDGRQDEGQMTVLVEPNALGGAGGKFACQPR